MRHTTTATKNVIADILSQSQCETHRCQTLLRLLFEANSAEQISKEISKAGCSKAEIAKEVVALRNSYGKGNKSGPEKSIVTAFCNFLIRIVLNTSDLQKEIDAFLVGLHVIDELHYSTADVVVFSVGSANDSIGAHDLQTHPKFSADLLKQGNSVLVVNVDKNFPRVIEEQGEHDRNICLPINFEYGQLWSDAISRVLQQCLQGSKKLILYSNTSRELPELIVKFAQEQNKRIGSSLEIIGGYGVGAIIRNTDKKYNPHVLYSSCCFDETKSINDINDRIVKLWDMWVDGAQTLRRDTKTRELLIDNAEFRAGAEQSARGIGTIIWDPLHFTMTLFSPVSEPSSSEDPNSGSKLRP